MAIKRKMWYEKTFHNIINILVKPIEEEFAFLFSSLFYISIGSVILYIITNAPIAAISILVYNFLTAYTCSLIISHIPSNSLRNALKTILLTFFAIFAIIDIFVAVKFERLFDPDILAIILGSNVNEINEFITTFFDIKAILGTISIFILYAITLLLSLKKIRFQLNIRFKTIITSSIVLTIILNFILPVSYSQSFIGAMSLSIYRNIQNLSIDLRPYQLKPDISYSESNENIKIVMVIGESFARKHSSLYGYSKETNPLLNKMQSDSTLYIFGNVTAPGINTIDCIKKIMSTYNPENRDNIDKEWYECTTLINVFKNACYKTFWISNQSKLGVFDNVVTKYSELCDSNIFVSNQYSGGQAYWNPNKAILDEQILGVIDTSNKQNELTIIHLMGQHYNFRCRYPSSFEKFTPTDYMNNPEHQRQLLSEYDNATFYNDFVISEIIKKFESENAILFYFPDHGLDVYESDDKYFSHGKDNDEKSRKAAVEIPFIVYMSENFKTKYPEKAQKVKSSIDNEFSTTNMIYTLMDIADIRFKDNDDVNKYSLFSNQHTKD